MHAPYDRDCARSPRFFTNDLLLHTKKYRYGRDVSAHRYRFAYYFYYRLIKRLASIKCCAEPFLHVANSSCTVQWKNKYLFAICDHLEQ